MSKVTSGISFVRRILSTVLVAALIIVGFNSSPANAVSGNTTVRVHLFTNNTDTIATMQNWQIYTWNAGGTATQGPNAFGTFTSFSGSDTYGSIATLNYTSVSNFTSIGFKIAYQGNWSNVDQNYDRFISVTSNSQDVWLKIGDGTVYTSDPMTPISAGSQKTSMKIHWDQASTTKAILVAGQSKIGNGANFVNGTWYRLDGTSPSGYTAPTASGSDSYGRWITIPLTSYYPGQLNGLLMIVADDNNYTNKDGGKSGTNNRWISTNTGSNVASTDMWLFTGDSTSYSGDAAFSFNPYGASAPTVTSVTNTTVGSGSTGKAGDVLTIAGTNLVPSNAIPARTSQPTVTIGGATATVSPAPAASAASISVIVPAGLSAGAKDVVVTNGAGSVTSTGGFTVAATPTITSLSSTTPVRGQTITVNGTNLSSATFTVGGVAATVATPNATAPSIVVPTNAPVSAGSVVATTIGGSASTAVTVTKGTPTLTSPLATAVTGGSALSTSTLTGGTATINGVTVAGTFAWTTPTAVPTAGTGSYSVTFTPTDTTGFNSNTTTASVEAGKTLPTVTATPVAGAITYGQTLASSSLTGGSASVAGTFAFATPTAAPNAGTATQNVTFTPTDTASYANVYFSVNVTVNKATPTVTATPVATAITYGSALNTATLSGGSATVAGSFAYASPSSTPGAGTANQNVTFTPTDTSNYNSVTAVQVSVTVNKATPTLVAPTSSALLTGGSLSSSILSGGSASFGGSSVAGTFAWTSGATVPPTGTASYSVTFTPTDSSNYNTNTVNVSVTSGLPTITSLSAASAQRGASLTINGTNLSSSTVTIGGTSAVVSSNTSTAVTVTVPTSLAFGSQSVVVTNVGGTATDSGFSVAGYSTATLTVHYNKQSFSNVNTFLHSWVQTGTGSASGISVTGSFSTQSPETPVDDLGYDSYGGVAKITYTGSNIQQVGFLVWTQSGAFVKDAGSASDRYRTLTSANDEIWIRNYDSTVSNSDPFSSINPNPNRPTTQTVTVHYDGDTSIYPKVYLGTRSDLNDVSGAPYTYWVHAKYLDFTTPVTISGPTGSSTTTVGTDAFGKYVTYTFPYNANHTTWANMVVGNQGLTSKDGGQASTNNRYAALDASGTTNIWLVSGDTTSNSGNAAYTSNPFATPVVSSLSASSGKAGDSITLTGTGLKPQSGTNPTVTVGGISAEVTSASDTSVVIKIPTGLTVGAASAVVVSNAGGTSNNDKTFTRVALATLTSVTPTSGVRGSSFNLTGTNFTASATVSVGGVSASVTYNSTTSLTVAVPDSVANGAQDVSVTTLGGTATSTGLFTVSKWTPDVTWPTAAGIRNPATLGTSELSGGSASYSGTTVSGTFAWASPSATPTSGTANYTVVFTPSSTNYSSVENGVSLTVAKAIAATPSVGNPTQSGLTASSVITAASGTTLTSVSATVDGLDRQISVSGDTYSVTLTRSDFGKAVVFSAAASATGKEDSASVSSDALTIGVASAPTSVSLSQDGLNVIADIQLVSGTSVGTVTATVDSGSPVTVTANGSGQYLVTLSNEDAGKSVVFSATATKTGKAESDATSSSSLTFAVASAPSFGNVTQSRLTISVPVIAGAGQTVGTVSATVDGVAATVSNTSNTYRVTVDRSAIGKSVVFTATANATGKAESLSASTSTYTVLVAATPSFGAITQNELVVSAKVNLGVGQSYGAVTVSLEGGELLDTAYEGNGIFNVTLGTDDYGKDLTFSATALQTGRAESDATVSDIFTFQVVAPQVSDLSKEFGLRGASITVNGKYLTGGSVKVGGTTAEITSASDTAITFVVPNSLTSGAQSVAVTTDGGTTYALDFSVTDAPVLTAFVLKPGVTTTSATINRGRTFTVTGTNLANANYTLGNHSVPVLKSDATSAWLMVPLDAQVGDNLSLVATTYYGGDSNGLSVSVIEHLPTITGFSASTIRPGQLFTIYGKWFTGLTSIVYCAKLGCVTGPTSELEGQGVSISDTAITVRAPINVPSGQIRITTVNGFNYSPSAISVYPTPKITATKVGGKASTTAQRGATVSLTGTTFRAASVTFGAATAQVAVSASPAPSDTTMSVVVPANATPGSVVDLVVTSQNGVTSAPVAFTIGYDSPTVSSMSTSAAKIGALLTINGTELTEITSVKFGLNKLADLTDPAFANSNTAVTVKVPTGAVTGPITLTARGGSVTTSSFTVYQAPTIASVTPAIAKAGTVVTVSGTNLTGTSFTIGGVVAGPAPSFTATATSAKIVVPAGATASSVVGDSSVGVTSDGGSTSKAFTVVAAPSITSLGSNSVVVGNELTINGSYLANPSASPSPAAVTAKVGTVVAVVKPGASASQLVITVPLTAVVGNNTVSVTTAGGTVNQNVTIVPLAPSITSLSVASQNRGLTVRITGTNLGTPTVTVGGVAATVSAGATATSATVTIPATAPLGAQSLVLTTAGGSDNESINVLTNLPTVTNVSQTGTKRGVGTVTVTGEFFAGATVKVGTVTVASSGLSINESGTSLTFTIPATAAASASATIQITNSGGTWTASTSAQKILVTLL